MSPKANWLFDEPRVAVAPPILDEELMGVARIFDTLAQRYTGASSFFIPSNLKDKKKIQEKRLKLSKLVERCRRLGVGVELYLTAQFEELAYVLKRQGLARPPMSMILSSEGITRFNSYLDRVARSFITKQDRLRQNLRSAAHDRIHLYLSSATRFQWRLLKVRTHEPITNEVANRELEMMARLGYVSVYYVAFSPVVDAGSSVFLQALKASILRKLNGEQQAALKKARCELWIEYEELGQYV